MHTPQKMEAVIRYQLANIDADDIVTPREALLKADLQEIFDLGFDQINEYAKAEVPPIDTPGCCPLNLDVFLTHNGYLRLKDDK